MDEPSLIATRKLKLWTLGQSSQHATLQSFYQHNQSHSKESTEKHNCIDNLNSSISSAPFSQKKHKTIWDDGHKNNTFVFFSNKSNHVTKSRVLRNPMSQVVYFKGNNPNERKSLARMSPQRKHIELKGSKMRETNINSVNCNEKQKIQETPQEISQPTGGIMNVSQLSHQRNQKNYCNFNKNECDKILDQDGSLKRLESHQLSNQQQMIKTQPHLRINLTSSTIQCPQTPQNSKEIQSNQLSPLHRSFPPPPPPPQNSIPLISNEQPSFEDNSFGQSHRSINNNNISSSRRHPQISQFQDPCQVIPSNTFSDKPIRSCNEHEQSKVNINPTGSVTLKNQLSQSQQYQLHLSQVDSQKCWEQSFKNSFSSCNNNSFRNCNQSIFANNQIHNQKSQNNDLYSSTYQWKNNRNRNNLSSNDQRHSTQRTQLRASLDNSNISKNKVNLEQSHMLRMKTQYNSKLAQSCSFPKPPKPYQELPYHQVDQPYQKNITQTTEDSTSIYTTKYSFYSPFQESLKQQRQGKLSMFRDTNTDRITDQDLKQRNIERLFNKQPLDYLKEFLHALVFTQRELEKYRQIIKRFRRIYFRNNKNIKQKGGILRILRKLLISVVNFHEKKRVKAAFEEGYSLQLFYEIFDRNDEGKITIELFKTGLQSLGVYPDQEDIQLLIRSYSKSKEVSFLTEEEFYQMVIPKSILENERLFIRKPLISNKNISDKLRQSLSKLMKNSLNGEIILEKIRDKISKEKIDLDKLFDEWMSQIKSLSSQSSINKNIDNITMRQMFLECGVFIHKDEVPTLMRQFTQNDDLQNLNSSKFIAFLTPRLL